MKHLTAWRPLLRDNGYLAFTELVWLSDDPAPEVAEFFSNEYPAMTHVPAIGQMIQECGYSSARELSSCPILPGGMTTTAPWKRNFQLCKASTNTTTEALSVIKNTQTEIEMRRRFGQCYGYQFFVARKLPVGVGE